MLPASDGSITGLIQVRYHSPAKRPLVFEAGLAAVHAHFRDLRHKLTYFPIAQPIGRVAPMSALPR